MCSVKYTDLYSGVICEDDVISDNISNKFEKNDMIGNIHNKPEENKNIGDIHEKSDASIVKSADGLQPSYVKEIWSFLECEKEIDNCIKLYGEGNVLCVLDLDNVIVRTKSNGMYWSNMDKYFVYYKRIEENYLRIVKDFVYIRALVKFGVEVFDDGIRNILENNGCKKIALTSSLTGHISKCFTIEEFSRIKEYTVVNEYIGIDENTRIEEFRYKQLKNIRIEFDDFKFKEDDFVFGDFDKYLNDQPVYYKGIICTNGVDENTDKGKVLNSFLDKTGCQLDCKLPKCIILIDDNKRNHDSVKKELKGKYGEEIKFVGLLYTGAGKHTQQTIEDGDFIKFWINSFDDAKKAAIEQSKKIGIVCKGN